MKAIDKILFIGISTYPSTNYLDFVYKNYHLSIGPKGFTNSTQLVQTIRAIQTEIENESYKVIYESAGFDIRKK